MIDNFTLIFFSIVLNVANVAILFVSYFNIIDIVEDDDETMLKIIKQLYDQTKITCICFSYGFLAVIIGLIVFVYQTFFSSINPTFFFVSGLVTFFVSILGFILTEIEKKKAVQKRLSKYES